MNIKLAREIYGQPWFIDEASIHSLTILLNHFKKGGSIESDRKLNAYEVYNPQTKEIVTDNEWLAKKNNEDSVISLINLNGAITKNGGESTRGTVDIAEQLTRFDRMKNVIGHIVKIDSGGGSAVAVKYMREAIQKAEKPVVAYAEDLAASAAYYSVIDADHIMANSPDAMIGSIGALIEFSAMPKVAEDKTTGERSIRIYADQSSEKNQAFEEAINNLNFTPIKETVLNPLTERFINDVKSKRPNVNESHLKGKIFEAKDVTGTLIDSIGTFEEAVNKVKQLSRRSGVTVSNNLNINTMTKQELQTQHPDVYAAIRAEEKERVEAILEFSDVDLEACKKMISDGTTPGAKFFAEMSRKAIAKNELKATEKEAIEKIEIDPNAENSDPKLETEKPKDEFTKKMRAYAGLKEEEAK